SLRGPASQTASVEVDPVEQHRQLRRLHLDLPRTIVDQRKLEASPLEPLQIKHEAIAVPEEDLHLVLRFADEDEDVSLVRVLPQRAFDNSAQSVDAVAHVDQRRREVDPDARRQPEHQLRSSSATTRANAVSSKSRPTLSM